MDITYLDALTELLQTDERLVNDSGELLKTRITEYAQNLDPLLIKLLLSNKKLKEFFFVAIDDVLIFNQDKFLMFVHNEAFLKDSYTAYKNKIGLADTRTDYVGERDEVVLNWPYKDCVLEGGQDKEDQKRDEIFWNEVLGADQRDVLLAPKVMDGFKKYDRRGVHDVEALTSDDNLVIHGNNLLAMHTLKKRYAGRVKLIYIDPPYYFKDTKPEDTFLYNSNFKLSTWLTFMQNRLAVARDLLAEDGVIFVQIKDDGMAHLKVMMDEIFPDGFVNCITVKMSEASGLKMSHARLRYPNLKEHILFYKKSSKFKGFEQIDKYVNSEWDSENNILLEHFSKQDRDALIAIENKDEISDADLANVNKILGGVKKVPLSKYTAEVPPAELSDWLIENSYRIIKTAGSAGLKKLILGLPSTPPHDVAALLSKENMLYYYLTDFNRDAKSPRVQVIFADANVWKNPGDFWQDIKTTGAIARERGVQLSGGKKPEKLLERIIKMTTKPGDLVLDYHAGSGTTAGVAHKMGRRWITIEQIVTQTELTIQGLQNVIAGDQTGISKSVNWQGGGDFVYMHLKNDVNTFIQAVEAAADSAVVSDLLDTVLASNFLSHRVDPKKLERRQFATLPLAQQKSLLIELVNKNKLYVNYQDIDDANYAIEPTTKQHNQWLQSRDA